MPRPINEDALKAVAQASGGRYLQPAEVNDVLAGLSVTAPQNERIHYRTRWTTLTMLSALVALLALEWIVRKARNLV